MIKNILIQSALLTLEDGSIVKYEHMPVAPVVPAAEQRVAAYNGDAQAAEDSFPKGHAPESMPAAAFARETAFKQAAEACRNVYRPGDWSDGVMVAEKCAQAVEALGAKS